MYKSILFIINLYIVFGISKLYIFFSWLLNNNKNIKRIEKTVLFLDVFPQRYSSGYKWRVESWCKILGENDYNVKVYTLQKDYIKFFESIGNDRITFFLIRSMWKRLRQIIASYRYETVIVRRELLLFNDYGNLFMEKLLLKIHPNAILDFDDDISAAKNEPRKISFFGKLTNEHHSKFTETLKMYKRFIVGSSYLKNMVLTANNKIQDKNIVVIPTCVDYNSRIPKKYDINKLYKEIVFGWVGGNYNLFYLDLIIDALNKIAIDNKIKLIVVSGKDYTNPNAVFTIENQRWSLETETEQIKLFDIGLMPIGNSKADRGKCGFKLIQYMGMGVVSIATNVTVNGEIIEDGVNGFLVQEDNSNWEYVLRKVFRNRDNFAAIGEKARQDITDRYSFLANKTRYLNFIKKYN